VAIVTDPPQRSKIAGLRKIARCRANLASFRWEIAGTLVKKRRLDADWRKLSANAHCGAEQISDCFRAKSARMAAGLQQLIRRSTGCDQPT
jgi:hypothetical protein